MAGIWRQAGIGMVMLVATPGSGTAAAPLAPSPTPAPAMAALAPLQPGEWTLTGRGEDAGTRRLCVSDLRQLLYIRHARNSCKTFVVSDQPHALIVTYECAAAGNGRTDLRVETSHLVQIRSQGVADGAPFAFALEARRIGECR